MAFKFIDNTPEFLKDMRSGIERGLLIGAELLATNIKEFTPVKTGFLQSKNEPTEKVIEQDGGFETAVTNNTEYGPEIEYGTTRIAPRAMFRKGGDKSFEPVGAIIKNNLPK